MQRKEQIKNELNGGRIYADGQKSYRDEIKTTYKIKCKSKTLLNNTLKVSPYSGGQLKDCLTKADHLDKTQQVLNILDKQIDSLNRIQEQNYRQVQPSTVERKSEVLDDLISHFSGDNQVLRAAQSVSSSTLEREFLLDEYIKRRISVTGECSCSFNLNPKYHYTPNCAYSAAVESVTTGDGPQLQTENCVTNAAQRENVYPAAEDRCRYCQGLLIDDRTPPMSKQLGTCHPNESKYQGLTKTSNYTLECNNNCNDSLVHEHSEEILSNNFKKDICKGSHRSRSHTINIPETVLRNSRSNLWRSPSPHQVIEGNLNRYEQSCSPAEVFSYCYEESGVLEGLADSLNDDYILRQVSPTTNSRKQESTTELSLDEYPSCSLTSHNSTLSLSWSQDLALDSASLIQAARKEELQQQQPHQIDSDYSDANYYPAEPGPRLQPYLTSRQEAASVPGFGFGFGLANSRKRDDLKYNSDEALYRSTAETKATTKEKSDDHNGSKRGRPLGGSKLSLFKMRLDNEFAESKYNRKSCGKWRKFLRDDEAEYERKELEENYDKQEHLITSGSSQELRTRFCSPIHALELSNRRISDPNDNDVHDERSVGMRAVKDIAKVTIPSLSALQYLPNQLNFENNPINTLKRSASRINLNEDTMGLSDKDKSQKKSDSPMRQTLDNLCLCNCVKSQQDKQPPQQDATFEGAAGDEDAASYKEKSNKKTSSYNPRALFNLKRPKSRVSESSNDEKSPTRIVSDNEVHQLNYGQNEKQSPSFLNILKKSPTHKSASKHQQRGIVVDNVEGGRGKPESERGNYNSLGSLNVDALEDNSLQSGRNSTPLKPRANLDSSSFLRSRSSSFVSSTEGESSSELRAKSACSSHDNDNHKRRKSSSPFRRLFKSSSKNLHEQVESPSSDSDKQQSFFKRSLNRLSSRKKNHHQQKHYSAIREQAADNSTCVSPTISISTPSLDEEIIISTDAQLDRSIIQIGPEITLNRVEYVGGGGSLSGRYSPANSSDLTTTRGSSNYCQHHSSSVNRLKARCGSEMTADMASDTASERAYSLPASPSRYRRELGKNSRSRSPRLSGSPVPLNSPACSSTRIEDGLKVCSLEHYEKHIGNIKENQIEAQKKLFKAWINHFCPNLIQYDLVEELRDGIKLIGLLAILGRDKTLLAEYEKLKRDKQTYINRLVVTPSSRLKHLSNVSVAINHMRESYGMRVLLNPMDIVSGKPNSILALCWSIILKFQLEQNFLRYLDDSHSGQSFSSNDSCCTSRLSRESINGDGGNSIYQQRRQPARRLMQQYDEFSHNDLVDARKKLLDYVNKRFNLKLTNLTSSLVDGDVLLIIVKNLVEDKPHQDLDHSFLEASDWSTKSNDDKLDHCFDLAQTYLNVPRLFYASDLRHQSVADDTSKPLLVYLSMLFGNSGNQDDKSSKFFVPPKHESSEESEGLPDDFDPLEAKIKSYLADIEKDDRYAIDKLSQTIEKINYIEALLAEDESLLDEATKTRYAELKDGANQITGLISWINEADGLFETTQKSSKDLIQGIERYQAFFSESNIPQITTSLCPTLERQYRECLSTAKQRILTMEQTLKNWDGYETSKQQLRDWLGTAEMKLADALNHLPGDGTEEQQTNADPIQHSSRCLHDLIEYFELEPNPEDETSDPASKLSANPRITCYTNLLDMNESISGSVLSIGSTASRISLQSSNKANYHLLFDEFELKCRLLAAMLDSEQKEALLMGVKELRTRLRYITEQRVPQIVGELQYNIAQHEMLIEEQNEVESDVPDVLDLDEKVADIVEAELDIIADKDEEVVVREEVEAIAQQSIMAPIAKPKAGKSKNKKRASPARQKKNSHKSSGKTSVDTADDGMKKDDSGGDLISFSRMFWDKLKRASSASFPFNIALLICLTGLCVVPLLQRNACCELTSDHIPSSQLNFNQKPT